MRIGFVGCGDAGDGYIRSLRRYPQLELAGVTDINQQRASQFCSFYSANSYPTLDALLADPSIEMVVNLTSPNSHFEVSKACLEAGKHLYSEKPLGMIFSQAQEIVDLAAAKGLYLSAAPCSVLGEAAQTLWRALRNNAIGKVRLVYAELNEGPLHLMEPHLWRSPSGAPYPYWYEFDVGVPLCHLGYYLTWLAAFFGPAKTLQAFSSILWPDRQVAPDKPMVATAPDFSVACITFASGVVARITCDLIAPHNHGIQIVGDTGVLSVDEYWNYSAPVHIDRYTKFKFRAERYPITKDHPIIKKAMSPRPRTYPPVKRFSWKKRRSRFRMDYARGVADLARAIAEQRPPRLAPDFCLHVNELMLAIQDGAQTPYQVKTTFKPMEPLDDAALKEFTSINW